MVQHLRSMIGGYGNSTYAKGRWVMSVPLPFYTGLLGRLRDAVQVVRGKAYAIHWPEPGELEDAMGGPV